MKGPDNPPKKLLFQTHNNEWEPVTIPPIILGLTSGDLEAIRENPLKCDIPCHSQTVEHTVALVSQATQRRRTEDTQLMSVLQVSSARKDFKGRVTHKRFSENPLSAIGNATARKVQRFENTAFNRVLYKWRYMCTSEVLRLNDIRFWSIVLIRKRVTINIIIRNKMGNILFQHLIYLSRLNDNVLMIMLCEIAFLTTATLMITLWIRKRNLNQ